MVGVMSSQRFVTVGGIRLAYTVSGDEAAPPMILLHALGEGAANWAPVASALADWFRVYAVDLRGHGASDRPGDYAFRLMRDDVIRMLDSLGLTRVTLLGHSMGAVVAFLVAMQQPDRVERLIIEDASPPYRRDRPVPERPADEELDFDWDVVPAVVGQVNADDPAAWEGLAAITARTLLIGGGPESHVRQDKIAEAAARIPHAEFVTIPVGHLVHQNRPQEFVGTVTGWLGAPADRGRDQPDVTSRR
jgi:3-oxoadipate enol-lactonase